MAQVQPAVNRFASDVNNLERKFKGRLKTVIMSLSSMPDTELITAIGQLNLFNEIVNSGYSDALVGLEKEYETLLAKAVAEANMRGVTPLSGAGLQGLEVLKDLNTAQLLGEANTYANTLTSQLFQNLYANIPPERIVSELLETNLLTHQLRVATYTGIKTFDDTARYKVFEGLDVRWTYLGPLDSRTRDECRFTKENEPPNGYTEKEVLNSGTPFGFRGGFNCRHSWEVR
tara:strand:+ start:2821 stop:3513 length:693 start_codon:yes stop_codon:yes gene_type:complete